MKIFESNMLFALNMKGKIFSAHPVCYSVHEHACHEYLHMLQQCGEENQLFVPIFTFKILKKNRFVYIKTKINLKIFK